MKSKQSSPYINLTNTQNSSLALRPRIQSAYKASAFVACLLLGTSFLPLACQKTVAPSETDNQAVNAQKAKADKDLDQEVVAYSVAHTVLLSDYKRCVAMHAFEGQPMSIRALANPRFQRDEARRCYQIQFLKQYAQEHGVVISEEARQKAIQEVLVRDNLPNQAALLERLAVSESELLMIAEDELIPKALQKYLASQIHEKEAKERYQRDFRLFDLEIASFDNSPNEDEIQNALTTEAEAIEQYFALAPWRFSQPPKAHFTRYAFTRTGTELEQALGMQYAQQLRQVAIQGGEKKATALCVEQAQLGCKVLNDGNKPYILERNDDNAWAFKVAVGYVPEVLVTEEQEEVWLLTNIVAPEPTNINETLVRKKVAKKLLTEGRAQERVIQGLKTIFQTQGEDLKQAADALEGNYESFLKIHAIDLERTPKALPRALHDALASLRDQDINLISDPILANGKLYIFRVKSLEKPEDASYAKDKDVWLERVASDPSFALVQTLIETAMPPISTLNIRAIQIHYGVLQPNGRIN